MGVRLSGRAAVARRAAWAPMSRRSRPPARSGPARPRSRARWTSSTWTGPSRCRSRPAGRAARARPRRGRAGVAPGVGRGGNDVRRPNTARGAPDDRPPRLPLGSRRLGHPGRRVSDLRRRRLRKARQSRQRRTHLNADRRAAPSLAAVGGGGPGVGARRQLGGREPARRRAQGDPPRPEHAASTTRTASELGIIAGVTNRTVVPGRADPEGPQGRHGRDRGQALLRPRRRGLLPPASARRCATSRAARRPRAAARSRCSS